MKAPPRFPPIKIRPDGSKGCRGCGGDIPPKRQTWCSLACKKLFDPYHVKLAVKKRAGERCEWCTMDLSWEAKEAYRSTRPTAPDYTKDCGLSHPYDFNTYRNHPLYVAYIQATKRHSDNRPNGEFDHIVPHSEGGLFVLENIRLLCRKCHLTRTREWRKAKALARKGKAQLAML